MLLSTLIMKEGERRPKERGPFESNFFHALHRIHLEKTLYPFTLRGEAYLNSGWKRALDLTFGTVGLMPSLLLIATGAGAMKVESPQLPALITQDRHGRGGEKFPMLKIRSQENNTSANGAISPTRVGGVLRRLSIDELPQIINVMRGDMAVVGRRPVLDFDLTDLKRRFLGDLPYRLAKTRLRFTDEEWMRGELPDERVREIIEYVDGIRERTRRIWERFAQNNHSRPGLTGLYQILGRRAIRPEHRVMLDNFYENHASLGLDLAIILATLPAIFSRRGAK